MATVRNPVEWGWDQLKHAAEAVESTGRGIRGTEDSIEAPMPAIARIRVADLKEVLARGLDDFAACRTDVIFLCIVYPVFGLVLGRLASGIGMLPLVFPLVSGFALVGPVAAVGLYEMSRRREQGAGISWWQAFGVARSPSFGAIVVLGLLLVGVFLIWLGTAEVIYTLTLGPEPPVSAGAFLGDVFTTAAGWALIGIGIGVGFLFALLVLAIAALSFPLLLDRKVGLDTAVLTSVRAVAANPGPMALWGAIVAGSLVLGSIPLLLGLVLVLPVLGHATWHLYRKVVPR